MHLASLYSCVLFIGALALFQGPLHAQTIEAQLSANCSEYVPMRHFT